MLLLCLQEIGKLSPSDLIPGRSRDQLSLRPQILDGVNEEGKSLIIKDNHKMFEMGLYNHPY